MNLSGQIMNIQTIDRELIGLRVEISTPDYEKKTIIDIREAAKFGDEKAKIILRFIELAYKVGHRDARHDAAELALAEAN